MPDTSNQNPKRLEKHDCSPTILIVGDDEMRRTLANNLRLDGYLVLEACDGAEALRIVIGQSRWIHVLLTELSVHGTTLAEMLKPYRPEMQTLFFTGNRENLLVQLGQILKPRQRSGTAE